ncbi:MAG: nicotinamide-nucleotide amidohydrolase family protein [Treponema sp.]|nr:nicotinamide-nucleotide amidohydrolase family protein [Treponema sp.]
MNFELDVYEKTAEEKAQEVLKGLKKKSLKLVLAESCTAGLISGLIANTEGASSCLWGSFVCYTQEAKVFMLGLDNEKLCVCGLVSSETADAMAANALKKSGANIAASITGLAGPSGDGSNVPVGTVWVSVASDNGRTETNAFHFTGCRNSIRYQAAIAVLDGLIKVLS